MECNKKKGEKSMTDVANNNKRIAKNTLLLYFRMLFTMLVSLFTSRVVLSTLGIDDFGIYNVVGGVVAMFGFLNAAMSTATQRYLTFELGRGDSEQLKKVFCTTVQIHVAISLLVVILSETVGIWFMYNKMVIPIDRMEAAWWVFQSSVLSAVVMIMSVPYNASIIAHERMSAFAYISVIEVILKLAIVYLLTIGHFDKLKLYAVLVFSIQFLIRMIYGSYCGRHFSETKLHWCWNKKLFKEMLAFAGWNLWGNCAAIALTQGVNILLNIFFGPVVNAARGIAVQVQAAVGQFSLNFQTAINPQITKNYATGDYCQMHSLIFKSSKFTYFLLLILSMPIVIETDYILKLWLGTVPDYTVVFLRLMIWVTIIDATANPLMVSAAATGRVRRYQSVLGGILMIILPISYIVLKMGANPPSVFLVHLVICVIVFIVRLFIVRPMIKLSLRNYMKNVIMRCIVVTLLAYPLPILATFYATDTFLSFIIILSLTIFITVLFVYMLGLNTSERMYVKNKIKMCLKG